MRYYDRAASTLDSCGAMPLVLVAQAVSELEAGWIFQIADNELLSEDSVKVLIPDRSQPTTDFMYEGAYMTFWIDA